MFCISQKAFDSWFYRLFPPPFFFFFFVNVIIVPFPPFVVLLLEHNHVFHWHPQQAQERFVNGFDFVN